MSTSELPIAVRRLESDALNAVLLIPALDTIVACFGSSTDRDDLHDRDLAQQIRARLLERS